MAVVISSEDPRSIKAIEIAAGASQWLKCRTRDGRRAYGVPSQCQAGRYYLVTCSSCDCPDFRRNGLSSARRGQAGEHRPCKHVLGVRLYCELVKAQQPKPEPRGRRGRLIVFPPVAPATNTTHLGGTAMSLSPSERTRLRESIALEQQLLVLAGPGVRPLLNRLSELTGEAASDATDHALRICGGILLEHGHEQLFEEIYARTLELESVKPGELRRFLFGEIAA